MNTMQGNKFRYYFKDAGGLFVTHTAQFGVELRQAPTYIANAPKEWQNMAASYNRSDKYRGVFTKYAEQMIYVGDGKKIIDYYAAYYGVQAELYFFIEVQENGNLSYVPYFDGKVNFERYNYANTTSNADILDNDVLEIIEANEDVQYEIELTDDNSEWVQLDGVGLSFRTEWKVRNGSGASSSYYSNDHILKCTVENSEDVGQASSNRQNGISLPVGLPATANYIYLAKTSRTVNVTYDFKVLAQHTNSGSLISNQVSLNIGLQRFDISGTAISLYSMLPNVLGTTNVYGTSPAQGKIHHVQGSFVINLNIDDTLYPVLNVEGQPSNAFFFYQDAEPNSFIKFSSVAPEKAPTKHRAMRPLVLWNELIKKATDNKYSGVGNYLDTSNTHLLVPGSALRFDDKISIKTTLKDFIKYCYVNLLATIVNKTDSTVEMDSVASTYNGLQSINNIGQVKDLTWNFSKEHLIGQIKVGYPNMEIGSDLINGKFEYNQTNQFTTGLKNIKAEYDIVSPYIASMYLQEILRSKLSEQRSTDNDKENLVYLVDCVAQVASTIVYYVQNGSLNFNTTSSVILQGILTQLAVGTNITIDLGGGNVQTVAVTGTIYDFVNLTTQLVFAGTFTSGTFTGSITYVNGSTILYVPNRPSYTSLTGVLDTSKAYNLRITPKEILKLHKPIIMGGVYNSASVTELNVLKFQSGDKNVLVSKTLNGITTTENENEDLSNYTNRFYVPIAVTFTTDYSRDFYKIMNTNDKYKLVPFIWKNNILRGFVLEASSQDGNYKGKQFTLLLQNGAELINFIN